VWVCQWDGWVGRAGREGGQVICDMLQHTHNKGAHRTVSACRQTQGHDGAASCWACTSSLENATNPAAGGPTMPLCNPLGRLVLFCCCSDTCEEQMLPY
jgi:hypothetical protein